MTKQRHEKLTQELMMIRHHCKAAACAIYGSRGYELLLPDEQKLIDSVLSINRLALTVKLASEEIEKIEKKEGKR